MQTTINQYYAMYQQELKNYLTKKLSCADTAADLTHETFVRLINCGSALELKSPRAYLYSIASNLLNDYFRAQKRRPAFAETEEIDAVADDSPSHERRLSAENEAQHLMIAIEALPPRCKEVFILHKFHHLSHEEVSQKLGIAKNTVMVHMMNGLAHCRRALNK